MKKSLKILVVVLVIVMAFGISTTAFAGAPSSFGYSRWGSAGTSWTTLQNLLYDDAYKNYVKFVQHYMNYRYYDCTLYFPNLTTYGLYGTNTKQRIRDFQSQNSLQSDGIVGTNTWGKIHDLTSDTGTINPAYRKHFGARKYDIYTGTTGYGLVGMNCTANYQTPDGTWTYNPYWTNYWSGGLSRR